MATKMKNWVANPSTNVIDLDGAFRSRERLEKRQQVEDARKAAKRARKRKRRADRDANHKSRIPSFFSSREWIALRYAALKRDGGRCLCCGRSGKDDGVVLNVDHIKSRTAHPELALTLSNLQVLCARCNQGKGWEDDTDWRTG